MERVLRQAWTAARAAGLATLVMLGASIRASAQPGSGEAPPAAEKLVQVTAAPVRVAAGATAQAVVHLALLPGWHVNANPPALDYNIPTRVKLAGAPGLTIGAPRYPKGKSRKFEFEETPLLVYDGAADVLVPVVATGAATGAHTLRGTVEFQACNDQVCLAPAQVPFTLEVNVAAGGASGDGHAGDGSASSTSGPDTAAGGAPGGSGDGAATGTPDGSTISPANGATFNTFDSAGARGPATPRTRLESALAQGGLGWFFALFAGGLLLNLTPCVFPMLGVTVSIFGARRKQPLPRVLTTAALYVLGICLTYTVLGVVAALTGGLFGSALRSVGVSVALGGLMLVLSFGMFGLFEMQPPGWLLNRLGGAQATNFAGALLSGLGVGIIAAPCVGPFVVAVLALIAQRGDVGFGFGTMFTLSLGLGFPYLLLATFSNLLQALPRSGDWMVWVKHGFGTMLASIGLGYVSVGLAPGLSAWVLPASLTFGGLWLGFLDRSGRAKGAFGWFTRTAGSIALFAGVVIGVEMYLAAAHTLTFKAYDPEAVAASVAAGRPVMMDFSADWCAPCHELELRTFSNERVVAEARRFDRYKVDLTKYDSPEAEASRKRYRIAGVPTVVFLGRDGNEIADARVVGFMAPEPFLGQMRKGAAP